MTWVPRVAARIANCAYSTAWCDDHIKIVVDTEKRSKQIGRAQRVARISIIQKRRNTISYAFNIAPIFYKTDTFSASIRESHRCHRMPLLCPIGTSNAHCKERIDQTVETNTFTFCLFD